MCLTPGRALKTLYLEGDLEGTFTISISPHYLLGSAYHSWTGFIHFIPSTPPCLSFLLLLHSLLAHVTASVNVALLFHFILQLDFLSLCL